MKILLRRASNYDDTKVIEVKDIMELKKFYNDFILSFNVEDYLINKFGNYDFEATIYDDYVE